MADPSEIYRRNAEDALNWADRAKSDEDKAQWLRIARAWLSLIPSDVRSDQDRFEEQLVQRGTRQESSDEHH
jgi:hypothetical protein